MATKLREKAIAASSLQTSIRHKGKHANFVHIDDKWGLKYWASRVVMGSLWFDYETDGRGVRNKNYENQRRAAAAGLGPKVGQKVNFKLDGKQQFGYITELAVPFGNVWAEKQGYDTDYRRWERYQLDEFEDYIEDFNEEYETELEELKAGLDKVNIGFTDDHPFNVGLLNGKFVCIDFDF